MFGLANYKLKHVAHKIMVLIMRHISEDKCLFSKHCGGCYPQRSCQLTEGKLISYTVTKTNEMVYAVNKFTQGYIPVSGCQSLPYVEGV